MVTKVNNWTVDTTSNYRIKFDENNLKYYLKYHLRTQEAQFHMKEVS